MRQLPAMRLICIALMSVILTLLRSAATSGLNRVNTPMAGSAMARRNISRRVKVVIDDRLQHGRVPGKIVSPKSSTRSDGRRVTLCEAALVPVRIGQRRRAGSIQSGDLVRRQAPADRAEVL